MRYSLVQTAAPSSEPLTRTEAKTHLREDGTDQDTLIDSLIAAARKMIEDRCGIQIVTATWRYELDAFPVAGVGEAMDSTIRLPRPPLASVTGITYVDSAGTTQTLNTNAYQVDVSSWPGRVMPAYGTSWPATRADTPGAVKVTYTAGAATASDLVKAAVKLLVGHLYLNREAAVTGTIASELPLAVECILSLLSAGRYE